MWPLVMAYEKTENSWRSCLCFYHGSAQGIFLALFSEATSGCAWKSMCDARDSAEAVCMQSLICSTIFPSLF